MRVRRVAAVTGAVAALVLLGGPARADETPSPEPTSTAVDGGVVDPGGNPDCFLVPDATDEPTDEATDEPVVETTDEPTTDPSDVPAVEPTDAVTDEPTADATDEPTADPTDEPTADPTDEPTDGATASPGSHYVCLAYTTGDPATGDGPTLGSGTAELPFSGAPVGRYAATGLALVLAGGGTVVLARRRSA